MYKTCDQLLEAALDAADSNTLALFGEACIAICKSLPDSTTYPGLSELEARSTEFAIQHAQWAAKYGSDAAVLAADYTATALRLSGVPLTDAYERLWETYNAIPLPLPLP